MLRRFLRANALVCGVGSLVESRATFQSGAVLDWSHFLMVVGLVLLIAFSTTEVAR